MSRAAWALASAAAMAVLAAPAVAFAEVDKESAAQAQALFEEGLRLVREGRLAQGCPKLERSQELDPSMGTEFRLAECYEGTGRVASAWALFMRVATEAHAARMSDRQGLAKARADALKPRIPSLTVTLGPGLASRQGIEVLRDGHAVPVGELGRAMSIDPGEHAVVVTAPGAKPWHRAMSAHEHDAIVVAVPSLEVVDDGAVREPPRAAAPEPPSAPPVAHEPAQGAPAAAPRTRFVVAGALGAVGVVGVVVGSVFGVRAKSQWSDTLAHCQDMSPSRCDATGVTLGGQASTSAVVSTVGFVLGGASLVAGVAVLVFSPRAAAAPAALRISPAVDAHGAGLRVGGAFF